MNRLELLVHQRALDKVGEPVALVEEALPVRESLTHLFRRRWHIGRVDERAARRPDPVLRATELAGRRMAAPHPLHQTRVKLADQSQGEGKRLESADAMLES